MNDMEATENFLPVPGFPEYRINTKNLEVRRVYKDGHWRTLKSPNKSIGLFINGKKHNFSHYRLLYAALKGINVMDIPRKFCVIFKDGSFRVIERSDISRLMRERSQSRYTLDYVMERYRESIEFSKMVLDAYETDNYQHVAAFLLKYKESVMDYIIRTGLHTRKEDAEELFMMAFDTVLRIIKEHKTVILRPECYLSLYARGIRKKERSLKMITRSYDEVNPAM